MHPGVQQMRPSFGTAKYRLKEGLKMTEYPMVRLVADDGKVLTNGKTTGKVVDVFPVEKKSEWEEIDAPDNSDE